MNIIFKISIFLYCIIVYIFPGIFLYISTSLSLYDLIKPPNSIEFILSFSFVALFMLSLPMQSKLINLFSKLAKTIFQIKVSANLLYGLILIASVFVIVSQIISFQAFSFDLRHSNSLNLDSNSLLLKRIAYLFRPLFDNLTCFVSFVLVCALSQGRQIRPLTIIPIILIKTCAKLLANR